MVDEVSGHLRRARARRARRHDPQVSEIDGERAVIDARELSTRKINAELRWLLYEQGVTDVTASQLARHLLGVGIPRALAHV